MFSGIVETAATVVALRKEGGNLHITMKCDFAPELRIDQSVAHNGVCLTVVDLPGDGTFTVTARLGVLRFNVTRFLARPKKKKKTASFSYLQKQSAPSTLK